jgi:hypothetical protein
VVVSEAVGGQGSIQYTDFLVSGAVVVTPAFLQLLKSQGGELSDADWQTAPQWLMFSSGTGSVLSLGATVRGPGAMHEIASGGCCHLECEQKNSSGLFFFESRTMLRLPRAAVTSARFDVVLTPASLRLPKHGGKRSILMVLWCASLWVFRSAADTRCHPDQAGSSIRHQPSQEAADINPGRPSSSQAAVAPRQPLWGVPGAAPGLLAQQDAAQVAHVGAAAAVAGCANDNAECNAGGWVRGWCAWPHQGHTKAHQQQCCLDRYKAVRLLLWNYNRGGLRGGERARGGGGCSTAHVGAVLRLQPLRCA